MSSKRSAMSMVCLKISPPPMIKKYCQVFLKLEHRQQLSALKLLRCCKPPLPSKVQEVSRVMTQLTRFGKVRPIDSRVLRLHNDHTTLVMAFSVLDRPKYAKVGHCLYRYSVADPLPTTCTTSKFERP